MVRENALLQEQANIENEWEKIHGIQEDIQKLEAENSELTNVNADCNLSDKEPVYLMQVAELTDILEKLKSEKESLMSKIKADKLNEVLGGAEE